jgi:catechol 2,3-dioxygenase-like lactoylglutathione lyase family enzyme
MGMISGVHHVALGVRDLEGMKAFYRGVLGFSEVFAEFDDSEQEIMREVARSSRVVFGGAILQQKAGGILLELIRMREPAPRPVHKSRTYGDIGVAKVTVAVSDLDLIRRKLKGKVAFCSGPKRTAIPEWGEYRFVYCRDPEGNLIELAEFADGEIEDDFGGARSIGVSVTDLDRSVSFYRTLLGLNTTVIKRHTAFSGLVDEMAGATGAEVRSCLLSATGKGDGAVEIFEVIKPRGRSIPFATLWGDFGYLQVAFNCSDIPGMVSRGNEGGMEFLCSPKVMEGGIPDHPGEFVYGKDPDGVPIEFLFLPE